MKKNILLPLFLLCAAGLRAQTADSVQIRLARFVKNIAAYDNMYSQEKVYLHLDNTAYFLDEKLWFKAYVTRASSLLPTDLSRVLYVELRSRYGELIDRKSYKLEDGQANGCFDLSDLLVSGYYEIRAYTRAMLNWDDACIYRRVIPVYDVPKEPGRYNGGLSMFSPVTYASQPSSTRPKDAIQHPGESTQQVRSLSVEFYPEGGWRVKGCASTVAFKATDTEGNASYTTGRLYDAAGNVVQTFRPAHDGMGKFTLEKNKSYSRVTFTDNGGTERAFTLPQERAEGAALSLEHTADSLRLRFNVTPAYGTNRLGISITCRGAATYFSTLPIGAGEHVKSIARSVLHDGVNQITLFTDRGEVLCERMVWGRPERSATMVVRQNEKLYSPFAPVVLDLTLANAMKRPVEAYVSLSVRDAEGDVPGCADDGLCADLLLSSDLRGYIERPYYYFEADDGEHLSNLDLLLMVQGWRRYEWKEMAGITPLSITQPLEEGQLVTGRVLTMGRDPLPDASLSLLVATGQGQAVAISTTDSMGNFAFRPKDFYGTGWGAITVRKNKREQNVRICLDRNFSPSLRAYDPREVRPDSLAAAAFGLGIPAREEQGVETFVWQDTIPKNTILLNTVRKTEKKRTNFASGRRNWIGGEEAGRRASYVFYNTEEAATRELDKGEFVPLLWDWLKEHDKDFDYQLEGGSSYSKTYKNRKVSIIVNNGRPEDDESYTGLGNLENPDQLMLDEVKSVYIVLNRTKGEALGGSIDSDEHAAILIYTYGNEGQIEKRTKGTRVTRFRGYEPPETFFSPNYRLTDAPDAADFRRTLYWNPDILTNENGHASVVFYSNARNRQQLRITARAVLPDGSLLDYSR